MDYFAGFAPCGLQGKHGYLRPLTGHFAYQIARMRALIPMSYLAEKQIC